MQQHTFGPSFKKISCFLIVDVLDIDDVLGQKYLTTRLRKSIKINEGNSAAALESMSRFAVDPHWLIYLPPTMPPCETSKSPEYLEYPIEAFDYYKTRGVGKVICQKKHMGSRAVIVLCKDSETAKGRFKVVDGSFGIIYTRTGRYFFDDMEVQNAILLRLQKTLTTSGFWEAYNTDWVCLDTELMPWSAKAQKLLLEQYAPVGRSGRSGLEAVKHALSSAIDALGEGSEELGEQSKNGVDLRGLLNSDVDNYTHRGELLDLYTQAYRSYCWEVKSLDDYRIAPFHILATEGKAWFDENHITQMDTITKYFTGTDPIFISTGHIVVDLLDEDSVATGVKWWEDLTVAGSEGMVVKSYDFIAKKGTEVLQPAIKCRGKEYLRIIYGPEYTIHNNLERLKRRSVSKKRSLALKEFALGVESVERFVGKEPLYRVHECVFGILAIESEPVDPRL
jgi:protein phosphatase